MKYKFAVFSILILIFLSVVTGCSNHETESKSAHNPKTSTASITPTVTISGSHTPNVTSIVSNTATPTDSASNGISKTIPFNYFYAGFVAQEGTEQANDENGFPVGTVLINTEKQWEDFKSKYLYERGSMKYSDMSYRFNKPANFDKESIIYNSPLSAKPDVFAAAYQIDKIVLENNQPKVMIKEFDNGLKITTTCYNVYQRYIILVTVNKSDLPQ